jgi:hypothetical protein
MPSVVLLVVRLVGLTRLLIARSFLVRMLLWIGFKCLLPLDSEVDLLGRNESLLYDTVRDDGLAWSVKKVQNSVVLTAHPNSKLVNSVTKKIRFWPSELMPHC